MTPTKDDEQLSRLIPIVFTSQAPETRWLINNQKWRERERAFLCLRHLVRAGSSYSGLPKAAGWPVSKMIVQSFHKHA